ncbi:Terpene synthase 12 [Melia azedarach]|uniref:Terpene synthase 12 n=1 Tax=Melia azedarach TaxID=155640 RepID=A0ACC1YLG2_MELAZ|nr:Terpene synthase 12 [Melia azedarach]
MEGLEQPFHTGVPRLEAIKYLSFYEHEECRNDTLLKFSKLDFNRVQLLHKQELGHLTRWDINAICQLPDYLKPLYRSLLNLFEELNNEMTEEGRSFSISFTKEAVKELVRAYFVEAQWFHDGFVPSFDERMSNALISGHCVLGPAATFIGIREIAGINAFEWLKSRPKVIISSFTILRLIADFVSHEDEQKRGHVASVVESYMKEYGTSRMETAERFKIMITNLWKDINEECMRPTIVPLQLITTIINTARIAEVYYKEVDGIANPEVH